MRDGAKQNPLFTTLPKKVENIDGLSDVRKDELSQQALNVIETKILPQYGEMIALFEELLTISNHDAGIWRLPNGEEIYRSALRSNNSTTLTADEIHQIGLSEVARIELEMEDILSAKDYLRARLCHEFAT